MGTRGLNESPRAEGRDPRASTAMPEAMLRKLQERASKALSWRFELPIHGVKGKAVFPDVVKWSPAD